MVCVPVPEAVIIWRINERAAEWMPDFWGSGDEKVRFGARARLKKATVSLGKEDEGGERCWRRKKMPKEKGKPGSILAWDI